MSRGQLILSLCTDSSVSTRPIITSFDSLTDITTGEDEQVCKGEVGLGLPLIFAPNDSELINLIIDSNFTIS